MCRCKYSQLLRTTAHRWHRFAAEAVITFAPFPQSLHSILKTTALQNSNKLQQHCMMNGVSFLPTSTYSILQSLGSWPPSFAE